MIKIIKKGNPSRPHMYFKATCPWCGSEIAFEWDDMTIIDPRQGVGELTCPICNMEIFVMTVEGVTKVSIEPILPSRYEAIDSKD